MFTKPAYHNRKSIRLPGYDYSQPGAYFVTLVSWQREPLFGRVVSGEMQLNSYGEIARSEWQKLVNHFSNLRPGAFIVMPNHLHGIIVIEDGPVGATQQPVEMISDMKNGSSPETHPSGSARNSIGAVISQFKSRTTKRIWKLPGMHHQSIWQRNYYDHVIRNEQEYQRINLYIEANPSAWSEDEYFSASL